MSISRDEYKNVTDDLTDPTRFEGFSFDLFEAIAKEANITKYYFVVKDKDDKYGVYNDKTKHWNGLIKDIMDKKADFLIGDITITKERKTAIDFSISFQTLGKLWHFFSLSRFYLMFELILLFICLGVAILFTKPFKENYGLFAFMMPLSTEVWLYTGTALLVVSIVEWLLAKYCHNCVFPFHVFDTLLNFRDDANILGLGTSTGRILTL